jgi:hypothetical protein
LALLISACSSDGDGTSSQESSVLRVSDIRTLGSPSSPMIVYNDQGDGISVWEVGTFAGRWLYYSLYDRSTSSWSVSEAFASMSNVYVSLDPQVVSNGTGFAVVWREHTDSIDELHASLYTESGWSTPEVIGGGETDWGIIFQLASNGIGYAVTWDQDDGSDDLVYVNMSLDGISWDGAVVIDDSRSAGLPRIASDGTGYAVVWLTMGRLGVKLYSGTSWSATEYLDDESSDPLHGNHQIASNGSGYSVVWSSWDGTEANLWNRTYYDAGDFSWSEITPLYTGGNIIYFDGSEIISNGTGYAVAYTPSGGVSSELYAIVNQAGNADWSHSTLLESVNSNYINRKLSSGGDSYVIAWRKSTDDIYASVYDGTKWNTSTVPVVAGESDGMKEIELAGFAGKYVITWSQVVNEVNSIFARVFTSDLGWGTIESLENGTGETHQPSIAVSQLDGITVAWNQLSETGDDLASYTNGYDGVGWSGEAILADGNYYVGSSYYPQLLANDYGKTLAVWTQDRNGKRALYANMHEDGVWGSPKRLSDSVAYYSAQIATDGNGFAVIWQVRDGTSIFIYVSTYDGISWSDAEKVGDNGYDAFFFSIGSYSIASNGSGYMLVYNQYDPYVDTDGFGQVYARQYDGVTWKEPVLLTDATYFYYGFPRIATNGQTFLSVWNQYDGTNVKLYSSEFDGEVWSAAQLIASDIYSDISDIPRLITSGLDYLVVWLKGDTVMGNIYTGSWGKPFLLGESDNMRGRPETPYAVSNGVGYAVAWRAKPESGYAVNVNIHDGATWSGAENIYPITLDDINFSMFGSADLLATAGDGYAVLWGVSDSSSSFAHDIYASIFDGKSWSTAEMLDVGSGNISSFQLASNGSGFLAAWLQDDGTGNFDVVSNRYDTDIWNGVNILDVDNQSAFDLNLVGDWEGYHSIWTQPEPDGDAAIRFPWAKVRF